MKQSTTSCLFADPRIVPGYDGDGGEGSGSDSTLTMDKVKEVVNATVNATVNNAIANLRKTDLPKIMKEHMDPVTAQLTSMTDILATLRGDQGGGQGQGSGSQGSGGQGSGGNTGNIPPEVNAALQELKRSNEGLKKQVESITLEKKEADKKAEEAERRAAIRAALGTLPYATDAASNTAFSIIEPHVKKTDDGTFIGGDNLPLEAFIQDFLPREHAYLLKPLGSGGSGAGTGGGNAGGKGRIHATTEMIKTNMKPEEREAVQLGIANALAGMIQK